MTNGRWKAPRIWPDSTVYIIGGGESLNKEKDLPLIHDKRVIGCNDAFLLGDWVDVCWFGDNRWWEWNREKLRDFGGLKVCCCSGLKNRIDLKLLSRNGNKSEGIGENPYYVSWNRSTGASAINLAYHFGAKKIVLLGFDMKRVEGKDNWHDNHKIKHTKTTPPYNRYLQAFIAISKDAKTLGVEIINCSMDSAITQFDKVSLEEVLSGKR